MTATLPRSDSEQRQRAKLLVTRRQATGLLAAVTGVFVAVTVIGADGPLDYVQATAEAAMVGGLADWFAVTALFRHPLGVPIPHTAIIPERKDRFGETLGSFVTDSFLNPDAVVERLHAAQVGDRAVVWLAEPANADRVAGRLLDAAVVVADFLRDEDVNQAVESAVRTRLDAVELAPATGRVLEALTRDGRHDELVDAALRGLARYLDENRSTLHQRLEQSSPWWLPGAVEDRIFGRLVDGARAVLDDMVHDRGHDMRRHLDERLAGLISDLQSSPMLRERGEQLKADLLGQPVLREYVASLWAEAKATLRAQAEEPDSRLRARLAGLVADAARRAAADPGTTEQVQREVERAARLVVDRYHPEFADLVSGTIARWDGRETADRLELLLGADLQFIRINGTVVGGLAGLVLHTVADVVG